MQLFGGKRPNTLLFFMNSSIGISVPETTIYFNIVSPYYDSDFDVVKTTLTNPIKPKRYTIKISSNDLDEGLTWGNCINGSADTFNSTLLTGTFSGTLNKNYCAENSTHALLLSTSGSNSGGAQVDYYILECLE